MTKEQLEKLLEALRKDFERRMYSSYMSGSNSTPTYTYEAVVRFLKAQE